MLGGALLRAAGITRPELHCILPRRHEVNCTNVGQSTHVIDGGTHFVTLGGAVRLLACLEAIPSLHLLRPPFVCGF